MLPKDLRDIYCSKKHLQPPSFMSDEHLFDFSLPFAIQQMDVMHESTFLSTPYILVKDSYIRLKREPTYEFRLPSVEHEISYSDKKQSLDVVYVFLKFHRIGRCLP